MNPLKSVFGVLRKRGGKSLAAVFLAAACTSTSAIAPAQEMQNGAAPQPEKLTILPSNTPYSHYIQDLNKHFRHSNPAHNIIIADPDWIALNRAANGIKSDDEPRMAQLMNAYVEQNLGYRLSDKAMSYVATDDFLSDPVTLVMGHKDGALPDEKNATCFVYPMKEDADAGGMLGEMIRYMPFIYDRLYQQNLESPQSRRDLLDTVNYHEVAGHCFDNRYLTAKQAAMKQAMMTENDADVDVDNLVLLRHKSEAFADVMGFLMRVKDEGAVDAGAGHADIRMLASAFAGTAMARMKDNHLLPPTDKNALGLNPEGGPQGEDGKDWDPLMPATGLYYLNTTAIDQAQKYVDEKGLAAIQAMSYDDLRNAAESIIDRYTLNMDEMKVIFAAMKDPDYFDMVKEKAETDPEYASQYDILKTYYSRAELAANRELHASTGDDAGECRPEKIVPEQINASPVPSSAGCGYAYPYADIRPMMPDDMKEKMKAWEADKQQHISIWADQLKAKLIEKGGDKNAVAVVFHEAKAYFEQALQSPYPQAHQMAASYLQILPEALELAVERMGQGAAAPWPASMPQQAAP